MFKLMLEDQMEYNNKKAKLKETRKNGQHYEMSFSIVFYFLFFLYCINVV